MTGYRLQPRVIAALDDIYRYSRDNWGREREDKYLGGFFETFEALAARQLSIRVVPPHFGVEAFRHRHGRHLIYWRPDANGTAVIFAVLHERMQQAAWRYDDDPTDSP